MNKPEQNTPFVIGNFYWVRCFPNQDFQPAIAKYRGSELYFRFTDGGEMGISRAWEIMPLNPPPVTSSPWVNPNERTPTESAWYICYVNGVRQPLMFNPHNKFWASLSGKTYKQNEVERWLDA